MHYKYDIYIYIYILFVLLIVSLNIPGSHNLTKICLLNFLLHTLFQTQQLDKEIWLGQFILCLGNLDLYFNLRDQVKPSTEGEYPGLTLLWKEVCSSTAIGI
jgi:hypothetical protein